MIFCVSNLYPRNQGALCTIGNRAMSYILVAMRPEARRSLS